MEENVILVDELDCEIGSIGKMEAHEKGLRHRAFSIFIINSDGYLLLQQRAFTKYHSAGLWSNTCCSHPRPGEPTIDAAHRRLKLEMGFDCSLAEILNFTYRANLTNKLIEHEVDHVLTGRFDGSPTPDIVEVHDWKWITLNKLKRDMRVQPHLYTSWLHACLERVYS